MGNLSRLAVSAVAGAGAAAAAFVFPQTPVVYFFAPGFWLGDALPGSMVNALGGYLFPAFASALVWTLLVFGLWLAARSGLARLRNRR